MDRRFEWQGALDPAAILSPLRRGRRDPTMGINGPEVWLTMTTPVGPATQRLRFEQGAVDASAWGVGADWLVDNTPELLGLHDDPRPFDRLLATLVKGDGDIAHHAGALARVRASTGAVWRLPRAGNVWESAVAAVLEQKVTGMEAKRAWLGLAEQSVEHRLSQRPA